MEAQKMDDTGLVFGLDIGTRNVVGTVGYRDEDEKFHVIAQYSREHDTRSMLDGQIHDIRRVGKTIGQVKKRLEEQVEQPLTEVCIAAAGRVLKTVTTHVDYEYPEETVVTGEMIHTLELLGIEKAHGILREENDTKYRFYCVGYSVMKYYINEEVYSNLEGHKAEVMAADIIVTFLPEDVVDGLYAAVGLADLEVANLTLEPIAAINVAIPEHFRMLNIALVDVGAGTSDICITKDGSIIAYGMIPFAGDEMTEVIVQHYLVDFKMAEHIKRSSTEDDEVEFEDIMSITHRVPAEEVWDLVGPVVDKIATGVGEKIIELNGDKTVSATFVVGGGGKMHGFVERLSEVLQLPQERVALRGEQVLRSIDFQQPDIEKDPLIVTPVGICLNYYEQKNNFIMVHFNGERIQLYDNNRLTIVDAALQAGFPNEYLFPRRGKAINFTVNGKQRMIRGEVGESSIVKMNGREVNINTGLEPNCEIEIIPSTIGKNAAHTIERLEEYTSSTISFEVNQKLVVCPRFVLVNGTLEPPTYQIQEGDRIEVCSYYTVRQLAEFMDVEIDEEEDILVNNRLENMSALIYENFSVDWTVLAYRTAVEDVLPAGDAEDLSAREPAALAVLGEQSAKDHTAKIDGGASAEDVQGFGVQISEEKPAQDGEEAGQELPEDDGQADVPGKLSDREEGGGQTSGAQISEEKPMGDEKASEEDPAGAAKVSGRAGFGEESSEEESAGAAGASGRESSEEKPAGAAEASGRADSEEKPAGAAEAFGRADSEEKPAEAAEASERADSGEKPTGAAEASGRSDSGEKPAGAAEASGRESFGEKPAGDVKAPGSEAPERQPAWGVEGAGDRPRTWKSSGEERAYDREAGSEKPAEKEAASERPTEKEAVSERPAEKEAASERMTEPAAGSGQAAAAEDAKRRDGETDGKGLTENGAKRAAGEAKQKVQPKRASDELSVFVNGETIIMHGKPEYVFIDVFDYIDFDLSDSRGRGIITQINDKNAYYTQVLQEGDNVVIRWEEKK